LLFKELSVVIVPLGNLDVKNIIVQVLDVLQVLNELSLELQQVLSVLRTLNTSEYWHHEVISLSCELELTLADFHEVFASLNEGFILSEDSVVLVEVPSWLGGVLLKHLLAVDADVLPLLAAINTLLEVTHTFLNITVEHVIFVDSSSASLDDLVTDLGQKPLHSLRGVVVFTQLPDNSDTVESFWKDFWDILWLRLLNLSAWLREGTKELKVVLGFVMTSFDLLLKVKETWEVRTTGILKNLNDFLKLTQL
jgi:hypothetical protein